MKKLVYLFPVFFMACNTAGSNDSKEKLSEKDSTGTEETLQPEESARSIYFKSLIGKYKLKNVSGFMGANTMTDYYK